MLNSEIKAAFRTFYREKPYALIRFSGLSLAIACCLILGICLRSELTYDQHHLKYDVLFRWQDPPNFRQALFGVSLFTYVLMPENHHANAFQAVSDAFFARFMQERLKATNSTWKAWLQPLADIRLHSDLLFDLPTGNPYYIWIFISCLGLSGLATFATEQRSKEIGIRKVLGASACQIITMPARKTLWMVLAGSVAASVIACFAIDEWMTGFAYRVGINLMVFVVSAAIVIAAAYITIASQSYKAAQGNPAVTVRYE
jgi:hypothetical protein